MLKVQRATSEGLKDVLIGTYRIYLNSGALISMVFWPKDVCFECLLHQITLICTPKGLCLKVWNTSIVQIKKMIELTNSRKKIWIIQFKLLLCFSCIYRHTDMVLHSCSNVRCKHLKRSREQEWGFTKLFHWQTSYKKSKFLLLNSLSVVASQIHYIYGDHPQVAMS